MPYNTNSIKMFQGIHKFPSDNFCILCFVSIFVSFHLFPDISQGKIFLSNYASKLHSLLSFYLEMNLYWGKNVYSSEMFPSTLNFGNLLWKFSDKLWKMSSTFLYWTKWIKQFCLPKETWDLYRRLSIFRMQTSLCE